MKLGDWTLKGPIWQEPTGFLDFGSGSETFFFKNFNYVYFVSEIF